MKTENTENALMDGDRMSGLHLLRRNDGSLRLEYDATEPGLHSIIIMVNGKHVYGSPVYCHVQKVGDSYSTVHAADMKTVMDFLMLEQNTYSEDNKVQLQSRLVDTYPTDSLWHNLHTDISCHYSRQKESLTTNVMYASENQNSGINDNFGGEPYSGMRLPVVVPDSSHPEGFTENSALSKVKHDDQNGEAMFPWKQDIKREIVSDDEERPTNTNKESTKVSPETLTPDNTAEPVEAIDLSLHHCKTERAEQASDNQLSTSSDHTTMESECQETAEKDKPTAGRICDDKSGNGNEDDKQHSMRRTLRKRLQQTGDDVADNGIANQLTNKGILVCPEPNCNQQFKTQIRLLVHKQVHDFLKSLGGPFSDGSLSSLVTLEAVKKPDLSTDVLMWYKCPAQSCMKSFKSIASLEKHLVLHCTPLYRCTEPGCMKCFHLKKTLVLHKSEHNQEKHICTKCGKSYRSKKHLQAHMRYHTDNTRKYVCTVPGCNSRFNLNRYLQQHMFTHKTTFDYLCQICGKAFKRSECLRAHLLSKSHKKLEQIS